MDHLTDEDKHNREQESLGRALDVWRESHDGDMKCAINELVWQYGHPEMTLHKAEDVSIEIFKLLVRTS
jgi:hypothetical protein